MAGFISQESIDEVSERTDIVRLVSEYVPLEQRGNDWWGCCPFHNEKTPSFSVSADKKFYYCFGCHASGTAFNFIMQMEKLSYAESVEFLAKKAGIVLNYTGNSKGPKEDPAAKLKEEYKALYTRVAGSFHYLLMETKGGKFALDYITQRGISKETLEKFKIGYSPSDIRWLRSFLLKKNYTEDFLNKSGLFNRKNPEFSFFCDRLMFPIFDRKGDVVAMGGRFLRGNADKSPKYLNSGDLIQYKKGNTLYAFNFAKQSIREKKKAIFCEGYMDCISYHQCGITHAVAPLGTALTDDQIKLVKPFVEEILLSFDSDGAGQNATKRAIYMCRRQGITVRVIQLHGGKDPAEIMLKFGKEYLTNEVDSAILDSDYLLSKLQELYSKDSPVGKSKASLDFFEYIDSLQLEVQKQACLDQLCQAFHIEREAAQKDFLNRDKVFAQSRNVATNNQNKQSEEKHMIPTVELKAVMTAVTDDVSLFKKMQEIIHEEDLEGELSKQLFIIMQKCLNEGNFSVNNILNRIQGDEFRSVIIQSMNNPSVHTDSYINGCIAYLQKSALERQQKNIQQRIVSLSNSPLPEDRKMLSDIIRQKMEIGSKIEQMKDLANGYKVN